MKAKIATAVAITTVVLVSSILGVTCGGQHLAESVVLPRVERRLGADLQWENVSSSLGRIEIDDLEIDFPNLPDLDLTIGTVTVDYDLISMLSGSIDITKVAVSEPSATFARIDSKALSDLRSELNRLRGSGASGHSSSSPSRRTTELELSGGSMTIDEMLGTTVSIEGVGGLLSNDGHVSLATQQVVLAEREGKARILALEEISLLGIREADGRFAIDEASVEGVDIELVLQRGGEDPRVLRFYRQLKTMLASGSETGGDSDQASASPHSLRDRVRLPTTVKIGGSKATVHIPVKNGGAKRTVELDDIEGDFFLGTDLQPPNVEIAGKIRPGNGRFDLDARLDREGHPRVHLDVTSLRTGQLAEGVSLSGVQLDDDSLLDLDVTVTRLPDGIIGVSGELSTNDVQLEGDLIADEPVTFRTIRATGRGEVDLDGLAVRIDDSHIWFNGVEVQVNGSYTRVDEETTVDLTTRLYPVHCGELLQSTPEPLRNRLDELTLEGTISGSLRFAVDTRDYDGLVLDLDLDNNCAATGRGRLSIDRLNRAFTHRVELPDDEVHSFRAGPGSGSWASLEQISPFLVAAILTTEDGRFFRHEGFNLREIRRALIRDLEAGRPRFGASTISMQLARNLFLYRRRTISRKLQEAVLTWYLEDNLSKEEILALYLNIIEYGPRVFGIRQAAMHYFGRQPDDLSPREAVFIAKLLPAPIPGHEDTYEEGELPPRWRNRVDRALRTMFERRRLSREEYRAALSERIRFYDPGEPLPHYRTWRPRMSIYGGRAQIDSDESPERWLQIDEEAELPAPTDLEDIF